MAVNDEAAPYRGGLSRTWLKVKVRHEGRFLLGGVGLDEDLRKLLFGEAVGGELRYRGTVESFGVSGARLVELSASSLVGPASAFMDPLCRRNVTWIEPNVAVEVQYNEITGGPLRAPVLRDVREAKSRVGSR